MNRGPSRSTPRPRAGRVALRVGVLAALLAIAVSAAGVAAKPASPEHLTAAQADSLRQAIEKDHRETLDWLRSAPTSYLATVQRRDFGDKTSITVGSSRDDDVVLSDSGLVAHALRVTVVGDSFRVEALDPGTTFRVKDAELRSAVVAPSAIGLGRFTLRLSHQRFPAIIVFDPKSPNYALYKGLRWFPADFSYRYVLSLTPKPHPDTIVILSTRGNTRRALRVGWLDFAVRGTACRLEATRLLEPGVGENDFGVFFRDATSGKQSYGLGRYVDVQPRPDGRYVLDFNNAYNPACAVSEHYNCPIPPRANRLAVAIRAGEMDAHYH